MANLEKKIELAKSLVKELFGHWQDAEFFYEELCKEGVNEEFVDTLIKEISDAVNQAKIVVGGNELDTIKSKLQKLKEIEELERKGENPDSLLDMIN